MNRATLAVMALLLIATVACTDNTNAADDPNQRLIEIYSATIKTVAVHDHPDFTDTDALDTVVYVVPRDDVEIPIDVQLGVVLELEEWATIRFIDELEEAIDTGAPNEPVRDEGILVGVGQVPDGTATVEVIADRYEHADALIAFELTLERRGGDWAVTEPVEGTHVTLR